MFQSSEKSRYQQVNSFQTSHNKAVTHNMNGNNRMGLKKNDAAKSNVDTTNFALLKEIDRSVQE